MNVLLLTKMVAEVADEEALIREITKLGVRLSVVVPGGRWRGYSSEVRKLSPNDYELVVRDCPFTAIDSVRVRTHIYYFPGISRLIGREEWDLVHIIEEPCNLATYQVARDSLRHGRRVVFTSAKNAVQRYPIPFNYFEKYVHGTAAGAIAGNLDALSVLRRKGFGGPAVCIQGGGMGVNPTLFRNLDASNLREKMGLKDAFVIGFVGQVAYRKGLDTLIKALALLPKQCALLLVGTGPDAPRFKSLAQELGLSARVRWVPWVGHQEIVKYMCALDAFVLPSRTLQRWREDFGRVLIEAMACETPVVGSDSGEIPNVIGDAGKIFHEGNERELAGHLLRLMEDPSLRESLGRRGRERVLEQFTYEKVARDTVEFYKHICSGDGWN